MYSELLRDFGKLYCLNECSKIFAGRSIASKDLVDEPAGQCPARYIRIRDARRGFASRGYNWVGAAILSAIEPELRLLAGDVLLSKSGITATAGIVRDGAVGGVAGNGLYVVRVDHEQLDPHFLVAYFASSACQKWLAAQSRVIAIQHFSELPVPLLPLSLQHHVAMQSLEHSTDVLDILRSTRQKD